MWQRKKNTYTKNLNAVNYSYRLLSYRARSEKELGERLREKGFLEPVIYDTLVKLKSQGFINDNSLAVSLKKSAEDSRLLGTQGVKNFLRKRGIPEEIIREAFKGGDSDETERAKKLMEKKLKTIGKCTEQKIKEKLWRHLAGKGYSFEAIKNAFKQSN
jgi:regulatory protein